MGSLTENHSSPFPTAALSQSSFRRTANVPSEKVSNTNVEHFLLTSHFEQLDLEDPYNFTLGVPDHSRNLACVSSLYEWRWENLGTSASISAKQSPALLLDCTDLTAICFWQLSTQM
jgi:hypothetical protein